jgi:hypothetical protein
MPRHSRGYWWDAQEKRWRIRFSLGAHGRSYRESLGPEWTEKQVIERVGNLRKQAVEGILGRQDRLISDALEVYLERAEAFKATSKSRVTSKQSGPGLTVSDYQNLVMSLATTVASIEASCRALRSTAVSLYYDVFPTSPGRNSAGSKSRSSTKWQRKPTARRT